MLDLLLRRADIVDGSGAPRRRGDIGIRDGVITQVGTGDEPARRVIDADGLVVAPGFIDIHTHYDVQLLWDPTASPSPLHGVTTVVGGNCGFGIAPMIQDHVDYLMRLMARVEGMPLASLQAGPDWDWTSFGEWLDRLDGNIAINAGFFVGHSTLRRLVMGPAAVESLASDDQIAEMVRLAHEAMAGGALGFSSSYGDAHTDDDGAPVPSRSAGEDEVLALCRAVRDHQGTSVGFIPGMGEIPAERANLMAEMSLAANRPLNWNLLGSLSMTEIYQQQLSASDVARDRGATVVALTLPDLMRMRASSVLERLPGWRDVVALPEAERREAAADPQLRDRLLEGVREAESQGLGAMTRWDLIEIAEARSPETTRYVGRTIAEIATERGVAPADVLVDVVLPERLPLELVLPSLVPSLGTSDEGWQRRAEVWRDPRTVLGGSDAGAHLDLMCHANYPTVVLAESVRRRELLTLEEAVQQMTEVPARLYGMRGRGRIQEGYQADLVVFDPHLVDSAPARSRADLPGDGERLHAESRGVAHVFVGGEEIVSDGDLTGRLAGTVLRSGRDTETVTVPGNACQRR